VYGLVGGRNTVAYDVNRQAEVGRVPCGLLDGQVGRDTGEYDGVDAVAGQSRGQRVAD